MKKKKKIVAVLFDFLGSVPASFFGKNIVLLEFNFRLDLLVGEEFLGRSSFLDISFCLKAGTVYIRAVRNEVFSL